MKHYVLAPPASGGGGNKRLSHTSRFHADKGFITVIRHVGDGFRQFRRLVPGNRIAVVRVVHVYSAFQRWVHDAAHCLRMRIDAIGALSERQIATLRRQLALIDLIDKGIAQTADADMVNITNLEVGVQGAGDAVITLRF